MITSRTNVVLHCNAVQCIATSAATPTHDETNYVTVSRYTSSHTLHCCNDKLAQYSKYCSIRRRIASCNVASWLKPRSERTGHESGEERERERKRERERERDREKRIAAYSA